MKNTIIVTKGENGWAQISKDMLNDPVLSWRAKGILSYLLGKPDGWRTNSKDIQNHGVDGRDAVRSGIKEIIAAGYAVWDTKREIHDGKSLIMGRILCVSDRKLSVGLKNPSDGEVRPSNFPSDGKPVTNKNDSNKTEKKQELPPIVPQGDLFDSKPSDHQRFIDGYCQLFELHFGGKYPFNGSREGKLVKNFLAAGVDVDVALAIIKDAFTRTGYPFDGATTITGLVKTYPNLLAMRKKRGVKPRHEIIREIDIIKKRIATHPYNREYTGYDPGAAVEMGLPELRKMLVTLEDQLAGIA